MKPLRQAIPIVPERPANLQADVAGAEEFNFELEGFEAADGEEEMM